MKRALTADEKAIVRRAREIISDPHHWTTGTFARDKHGQKVNYRSDSACQFCALGAISRAAFEAQADLADVLAKRDAIARAFSAKLSVVNDDVGHEAVLRVLDAALV